MSILSQCIRLDPEYRELLRAVSRDFREKPLPILASGLCEGASDAFLIALLQDTVKERGGRCALLLCAEEKDCVRLSSTLERNGVRSAFYMARDLTFYNITASHEYEHERLRVLSGLLSGSYDAVVTTPDALLGYTIPPQRLRAASLQIGEAERLDLPRFSARLTEAGFARVDLVDSPGQFALRGGILDVYPPHGTYLDRDGELFDGAYALRVELFGPCR